MEEVMGWLLRSQTSTPTFDCSGNSNSTVTSCTPLASPSTIPSVDSIDIDPFGIEQLGHNVKFEIQGSANDYVLEESLTWHMTANFVIGEDQDLNQLSVRS
ncbi:hypothetical protein KC19_3G038300 [Ceratodon purpureus]|uniref:Uncharacterized protein n=1 Tax=Ceratodon purpureus TaxID=3225 RepID=A0A8T0IHX2_CERPU|nr:hypothetical protein KC19_3G038300 [Ceratodon purpureus]